MKKPINNGLHAPSFRNLWVRFKLTRTRGRKFRILIYARYSTDEQNPRSIEDQVLYCTQFLESLGLKVGDYELTVLSDEGVSGEKLHRDGIDEVWAGIKTRRWDAIVGEDAGRFYRDARACVDLVCSAVDKKTRVFCINDEVDTADEENWEDRLYEAARHHQKANKYTSRRIKRAHEALWAMGAAIGHVKSGYLRKPTKPAADGQAAEGPYYDFIDPQWEETILKAYEHIAAGVAPWPVAHWLTLIGLPKTGHSKNKAWTDRDVIAMIRRTDYRGVQRYRDTVSKKNYRTGGRRGERSTDEQKLTREMPHLRMVSDHLWSTANKAIDGRCTVHDVPTGADHGLHGVPRDSRGPMSKMFRCGVCGAKMHKEVRSEGGYRCSRAGHGCWNMSTCLCEWTDGPIYAAVIQVLKSLGPHLDRLLQRAAVLVGDVAGRESRRVELSLRQADLEAAVTSLNDALEKSSEPLESTVTRLAEREADLADVRAELDGITQDDLNKRPPTRKEVEQRIDQVVQDLTPMDRKARDTLMFHVGTIHAVPHRQFGGNKVVLRAQCEIHLAALLPMRTRAGLVGMHGKLDELGFERLAVSVNLFDPTTGPKYGFHALALREQGVMPTAIGKALGITKRQADIAVQYGKDMRAAGVTDPFQPLTGPPEKASRWGKRKRNQSDDDRAA